MHYFSNFETKFLKLFATALITIGRHVTVSQPHYWSPVFSLRCKKWEIWEKLQQIYEIRTG